MSKSVFLAPDAIDVYVMAPDIKTFYKTPYQSEKNNVGRAVA